MGVTWRRHTFIIIIQIEPIVAHRSIEGTGPTSSQGGLFH